MKWWDIQGNADLLKSELNFTQEEHDLLKIMLDYCFKNRTKVREHWGLMIEKKIQVLAEKLGVKLK